MVMRISIHSPTYGQVDFNSLSSIWPCGFQATLLNMTMWISLSSKWPWGVHSLQYDRVDFNSLSPIFPCGIHSPHYAHVDFTLLDIHVDFTLLDIHVDFTLVQIPMWILLYSNWPCGFQLSLSLSSICPYGFHSPPYAHVDFTFLNMHMWISLSSICTCGFNSPKYGHVDFNSFFSIWSCGFQFTLLNMAMRFSIHSTQYGHVGFNPLS